MKSIIKQILLIVIGLNCLTGFGQFLSVKKYAIEEKEDMFNHVFMANNNIKSINAEIFYKKEMKPMNAANLIEQYYFNENGLLHKMIRTNHITGGRTDTAVVYLNYFDDDLIKKTQLDAKGFFSHTFELDPKGNVIKDTYSREENQGYSRFNFIQGKSFTIFYETYSYEFDDKNRVTKKSISNSDGKPYQNVYYSYDVFDNLIKETSTLVVTKKSNSIEYTYNEFHQLIEKKIESNFFGKNITIHTYEYDDVGNLLSEKITRNGKPKTSIEFVYDGRMLLKALLIKDESSGTIKVTKYKYQFYNE